MNCFIYHLGWIIITIKHQICSMLLWCSNLLLLDEPGCIVSGIFILKTKNIRTWKWDNTKHVENNGLGLTWDIIRCLFRNWVLALLRIEFGDLYILCNRRMIMDFIIYILYQFQYRIIKFNAIIYYVSKSIMLTVQRCRENERTLSTPDTRSPFNRIFFFGVNSNTSWRNSFSCSNRID